jgi:hypothetical protein
VIWSTIRKSRRIEFRFLWDPSVSIPMLTAGIFQQQQGPLKHAVFKPLSSILVENPIPQDEIVHGNDQCCLSY